MVSDLGWCGWAGRFVGGLLLALSSLGSFGCAMRHAPGVEVLDSPTALHELPSGLRVVLERDASHGVGGVALLVGAGAADDPAGADGLAHVVEHLVFHSHPPGKPDLFSFFRDLGGWTFNGTTDTDTTSYHVFAQQRDIPVVLERFAALLDDPLSGVDEQHLAHEKRVVSNELRLHIEESSRPMYSWLGQQFFPATHPYARSTGGRYDSVASLDLAAARAFVQRHYRPENITLAVSGVLDPADVRQALGPAFARHFSVAAPRKHVAPRGIESVPAPSAKQASIRHFRVPTLERSLWVGWLLNESFHERRAVLEVLDDLVEDAFHPAMKGCSSVDVYTLMRPGQSMLVIRANDPSIPLPDLYARIVRRVRRGIAWGARNPDALTAIKHEVAGVFAYSLESRMPRLLSKLHDAHYHRDPLYVRELSERLDDVSQGDLLDLLSRDLTAVAARAVYVEPGAATALGTASPLVGVGTPVEGESQAELGPPTAQAVALAGLMPSLGIAKGRRRILDNGLRVLVLSRPSPPYHSAALGFEPDESLSERTLAQAANYAVYRTYPRAAEELGLRLDSWQGAGLQVRSTGSNIDRSLHFVRQHLTEYTFVWPSQTYAAQRDSRAAEENSPSQRAVRHRLRQLLPDHPLGRRVTTRELDGVLPKAIERWRTRAWTPKRGLLVIAGAVDAGEALEAAADQLGDWQRDQPQSSPVKYIVPGPPQRTEKLRLVPRTGATQTYLDLACRAYPFQASQGPALELAALLWDEELLELLRVQLGATYTPHAGHDYTARYGVLFAQAAIDNAQLPEAMRILRGYFVRARAIRVDQQILDAARMRYAQSYWADYETPSAMAWRVVESFQRGIPPALIDAWGQEILRVTPHDVQALWSSCQKTMVMTAVGDEDRIREAWKAAGGSGS